ncbi:MAG: peptide chain release factor N(5)-glutamine methyltransferase [Hyphomicrobiales bacterium]
MVETFEQAVAGAAGAFRAAGLATPALDARLLLCNAANLPHETLIVRAREPLPADTAARFKASVLRRVEREPVSRITGSREFYGRDFCIGATTLDPRPDTETLIEAALDIVAQRGWHDRPLKLLDLGTGSGCILLTLLAELPRAEGLGVDIDERALKIASENASRLGVASRARFAVADWFEGLDGRFDLIVANPPYIPTGEIAGLAPEVADHDPRTALDGGADGLDAYRRIAARAANFLAPEGALLVEIGVGQEEAVPALLQAQGLRVSGDGVLPDLSGRPRAVLAEAPEWAKMRLERRDVQGRFVLTE